MKVFISGILLFLFSIPVFPAAAGPPTVKLVVSPPNLVFRLESPLKNKAPAIAELHVQVLAPPHQSWRLTVLALGPLLSAQGIDLPVSQISWRGSPGSLFVDGTLSAGNPQLCGQGIGPKTGLLRFIMQPSLEAGAGQYNQKLSFFLSAL